MKTLSGAVSHFNPRVKHLSRVFFSRRMKANSTSKYVNDGNRSNF